MIRALIFEPVEEFKCSPVVSKFFYEFIVRVEVPTTMILCWKADPEILSHIVFVQNEPPLELNFDGAAVSVNCDAVSRLPVVGKSESGVSVISQNGR